MITHTVPKYEYLPSEGIETIHETTMRVLEEFGIAFNHDEAVDVLERAGCEVDRDAIPAPVVKFPRGFVMEQIAQAAKEKQSAMRNMPGEGFMVLTLNGLDKEFERDGA